MEYLYTKTPLSYQITEYDCGQTTFLNAIRYLFERKEIEPRVIKKIMQTTLDKANEMGEEGKGGTSMYSIEFLSNWLEDISEISSMKMETKILKNEEVNLENEQLKKCLANGGVAILSVWLEGLHYVLCTKIEDDFVYIFDPYYLNINFLDDDEMCEIIKDRPFEFNRKVRKERLEEFSKSNFSLTDGDQREILLIQKK